MSDPPPLVDDVRVAFALAASLLVAEIVERVRRADDDAAPAAFPRHLVDVNAAPVGEIDSLPGVGRTLARRIVDARTKAPFATVDDVARVPGVGRTTLERMRPFARVRGDERSASK